MTNSERVTPAELLQFLSAHANNPPYIPERDDEPEVPAPLSPEREAEIRPVPTPPSLERLAEIYSRWAEVHTESAPVLPAWVAVGEVLAKLERVQGERDAFRDQRNRVFETNERLLGEVQEEQGARLRVENENRKLIRERDELKKRVAELERPAIEAKRAEIRSSYSELIAQCEQDRDFEGAFDVQCRFRECEEQWKREDEEAGR